MRSWQVFEMLVLGGHIKEKQVVDAMVERIFQRLDQDQSNSLDYEVHFGWYGMKITDDNIDS